MTWQPTLSWQNAQRRAKVLQQIREFFAKRNVIEVETPALSQGTVTDLHLDAINCRYRFLSDSSAEQSTTLYLQTSPEFHMKRMLAAGYGCIYQISKAFRHEEFGRYHNPEFTMLEWYRVGFDHHDLMVEVADLLSLILQCQQPTMMTYQEVFQSQLGLDPLVASRDDLIQLISVNNLLSDWLVEEQDDDILLQFIFSEMIEPNIGQTSPCFIYNFPSSQASLAKICPDDVRVAQRFECYFQGIELVNGFNELTNAEQQFARFTADNQQRVQAGKEVKSIDKYFIQALTEGLPACAGVALGIDRLVMLAIQASHIQEVISFPVERA